MQAIQVIQNVIKNLKGEVHRSRAQMKDNLISVPMVYLSPPYDIANLPYRRFSDCVSMATTGACLVTQMLSMDARWICLSHVCFMCLVCLEVYTVISKLEAPMRNFPFR